MRTEELNAVYKKIRHFLSTGMLAMTNEIYFILLNLEYASLLLEPKSQQMWLRIISNLTKENSVAEVKRSRYNLETGSTRFTAYGLT